MGPFLIKFSFLSTPTKIEELTAGSDEKTQCSPSSSIFVGVERKENLIRNDPDKSEFTMGPFLSTPYWNVIFCALVMLNTKRAGGPGQRFVTAALCLKVAWILHDTIREEYFYTSAFLVQIQEEQRQCPQRFARRLHQVGKRAFPYLMKPPGETLWKLSLFFLYLY